MPNVYTVFNSNAEGEEKGHQKFRCVEKSGCCVRQFCSPECRPFKVNVETVDSVFENYDKKEFLRIDRPCQCTFYCCNRPEIIISYIEDGRDEQIGKVVDPFNFCNLIVHVYDASGMKRYTLDGSCCQLGIWCKWPCDPCQTINFKIKNENGEEVSDIIKKSAGCCKNALVPTSNFQVNFPNNASPTERALLMCATIFMDYRFFEEQPQKQPGGGNIQSN